MAHVPLRYRSVTASEMPPRITEPYESDIAHGNGCLTTGGRAFSFGRQRQGVGTVHASRGGVEYGRASIRPHRPARRPQHL